MRKALYLLLAILVCLGLVSACAEEEAAPSGRLLWFVSDQSMQEVPTAALASQPYQGESSKTAQLFPGPLPLFHICKERLDLIHAAVFLLDQGQYIRHRFSRRPEILPHVRILVIPLHPGHFFFIGISLTVEIHLL